MPTDPARWARIEAVLDEVLDLPTGERRARVLACCTGDDALAADVLALLDADARVQHDFLAPPPADAIGALLGPESAEPALPATRGRVVGAYRLTSLIGEGGMGAVYDAERADGQFASHVAVKVMRWSGATADARRRFLRERQILAQLDHPHIARLFDGGVTDDGVPYFVMERVTPGTPITAWCDEHRLEVEARIGLVLQACDAVQYAHRQLVVHRDLKPSNIVVDQSGAVKLLDFGIAKLLADDDGPFTTASDARPMTPAFAAPEQVSGAAITTATDVYALGVVAYVALTGRLPYDAGMGRVTDWARAVVETLPMRPSTAAADASRQTRLRGDLDRILLKALAKEPAQRYGSVEAFADDLRRHLAGQPVHAHEPSTWYRARKFVGRNRLLVGGTAATVAALAIGLGATLWQAQKARAETRRAEAVQGFLVSVFTQADPDEARGDTLTAREILDKGAARIETEFAASPEVRATLWDVVRTLYGKLGAHAAAVSAATQGAEAARAAFGADSLEYGRALRQLATEQSDAEDNAAARASLALALPIIVRRAGERSDEMVAAMSLDGWVTSSLGDHVAGVARMRQARDLAAALHGIDSEQAARIENDLLVALGDADEALDLARHVATVYARVFGATSYNYSLARYNFGNQLYTHGRWAEALEVFATVVPLQEKLLGPNHPETALTYRQVARLAAAQGDFEQARTMMGRAITALDAEAASRAAGLALARNQLSNIERMSGRFQEAISLGEQAVAALRVGETPSNVALALGTLASSYLGAGRPQEALAAARDSVRISEGQDARWLGAGLLYLGAAQLRVGLRAEALATLQRTEAAFTAAGQDRSTDRATALVYQAAAEAGAVAPSQREERYRRAIALFAEIAPAEHADAVNAQLAFAQFLHDEHRDNEAAPVAAAAVAALRRSRGVDAARVRDAEAFAASLTRPVT